jgi:uncharacterized protein YbjT (DUF2867 family)
MKIILFGGTGNLGKEIARELIKQGHDVTAIVRNKDRAEQLKGLVANCIVADVTNSNSLIGICNGFDIVVSSLGKSVSPNDKSKTTFYDIDFVANSLILEEAKKNSIKKFVYVSALHSEKYLHLEYFKVHHDFSEKLKQSGIDYSIIKPPAIFSAYTDMIQMARKGQLANIGSGDKKTNPIYEGDLAKICVDSIKEKNATIEAGGKNVYSRKQLNEIIQQTVSPNKKVRNVPLGVFKFFLPAIKIFNKNMYDKFAFFTEVIQHDTIAPLVGEMKFEDYINLKTTNKS